MKLIIEVEGGCVSAVYLDNPLPTTTNIFVVDLDGAKVGESIYCTEIAAQVFEDAPDLVKDALTDGMKKGEL